MELYESQAVSLDNQRIKEEIRKEILKLLARK